MWDRGLAVKTAVLMQWRSVGIQKGRNRCPRLCVCFAHQITYVRYVSSEMFCSIAFQSHCFLLAKHRKMRKLCGLHRYLRKNGVERRDILPWNWHLWGAKRPHTCHMRNVEAQFHANGKKVTASFKEIAGNLTAATSLDNFTQVFTTWLLYLYMVFSKIALMILTLLMWISLTAQLRDCEYIDLVCGQHFWFELLKLTTTGEVSPKNLLNHDYRKGGGRRKNHSTTCCIA